MPDNFEKNCAGDHSAESWPLLPFEQYMVVDERPGYPMVIPFVLHFSGVVDRGAFESAVAETLDYEPLLTGQIARRRWGLAWTPSDEEPSIQWSDDPRPWRDSLTDPVATEWVNREQGPCIRIGVRSHPDGVVVAVFVHHAATDGLGLKRFVADLLARYGRLVGDADGLGAPAPRADAIADRGELDIEPPEHLSALAIARGVAGEVYKWLAKRPKRLATVGGDKHAAAPVLIRQTLGDGEMGRLRDYAKGRGVTLNDVLLRDLLLTLADWNQQRGVALDRDALRVLVPTNLRVAKHKHLPAANVLGYAFVTRTPADCRDPDGLLSSVAEEMKLVVAWSLGSMFLDGVRLFRRLPGALRLLTSDRFCHATTVLSNVGALRGGLSQERFRGEQTFRVGGLVLEEAIMAPPVRPHTWASFCVMGHRDRLTLGMNVDLRQVDEPTAQRLLESYCQRLATTAAS